MVAKRVLSEVAPAQQGLPLISHRLQEAEEGLSSALIFIAQAEETAWQEQAFKALSFVATILFAEKLLGEKGRLERVIDTVASEMTISQALRVLKRLRTFADGISLEESKRLVQSLEALFSAAYNPIDLFNVKSALRAFDKIDWQWVLFQVAQILPRVGRMKGWVGVLASGLLIIIHQLSRLFK